jgi:hypothetical protein
MNNLFDSKFDYQDRPKLPTITQYVSETDTSNRPKKYLVTLIWLPKKFSSYGLETEHFRATIHKDSFLGTALGVFCDTATDFDSSVYVTIEISEKGKLVMLFVLGKDVGKWVTIRPSSPLGLKFEFAKKHTKNVS